MFPRRALLMVIGLSLQAAAQAPPAMNGGLPAASPDGKRIAFFSDRGGTVDVYVLTLADGGIVRLTDSPDREGSLSWITRDEVGYTTGEPAAFSLYAVKATGGAPRLITQGKGRGPLLHVDGKRVLYSAGQMPVYVDLVEAPLAGGSPKAVVHHDRSVAFNPAWSPDGKRLAYAVMGLDENRAMNVWTANADGSDNAQLTTFEPAQGRAQWPAWSPDGSRIAVQVLNVTGSNYAEATAHIWIFDVRTGKGTQLNPHAEKYLDETPTWVDNATIAFQSNRTGRMEIWLMSADGTNARQLTR